MGTRLRRRVPTKFLTKALQKIFSFPSSAGENFPTAFKHIVSLLETRSLSSFQLLKDSPSVFKRNRRKDFCSEFSPPPPNKCFQELFISSSSFLPPHPYEHKKAPRLPVKNNGAAAHRSSFLYTWKPHVSPELREIWRQCKFFFSFLFPVTIRWSSFNSIEWQPAILLSIVGF